MTDGATRRRAIGARRIRPPHQFDQHTIGRAGLQHPAAVSVHSPDYFGQRIHDGASQGRVGSHDHPRRRLGASDQFSR